jgi:ankyrin repeat protein
MRIFCIKIIMSGCRFNPDNLDLVKLLVQNEPASIETNDDFNRFPLHVVIDARCSKEDIIAYLLKKNPQASRHIILQLSDSIARTSSGKNTF